MKKWVVFLLLYCLSGTIRAYSLDDEDIKSHLKILQEKYSNNIDTLSEKKCLSCTRDFTHVSENLSPVLVFASFSMPDGLWVSLSQEVEKIGGTFILQGIPDNSFKELANKIYQLRQKGVKADIQLHPKLFDQYGIKRVPTFVVVDDQKWDKLSGSVSLEYVLKEITKNGECKIAAQILKKLYGEKQ
jgi:type-F conjugative transfer system pilin assembly protein TrbC